VPAPPADVLLERLAEIAEPGGEIERKRMMIIVNPYATTVSDRLRHLVVYALQGRYDVTAIDTEARVVQYAPVFKDATFLYNQKGRQSRAGVADCEDELRWVVRLALLRCGIALPDNAIGTRCKDPRRWLCRQGHMQ